MKVCFWIRRKKSHVGELKSQSYKNIRTLFFQLKKTWQNDFVFIHSRNLTWNLKTSPWKRKLHLETIILRFHVKFRGCKWRISYGWILKEIYVAPGRQSYLELIRCLDVVVEPGGSQEVTAKWSSCSLKFVEVCWLWWINAHGLVGKWI